MCHDLSFSAKTVEYITDLIPNIVIDNAFNIDFSVASHVLSMSHKNCPAVYLKEGTARLMGFEWGLVADFMKTEDLLRKYRNQMANARSENILDKKSAWYKIRQNRCLIAVNGIYEHRRVEGVKNKIPYFIQLRESKCMLLPAIYNYSPIPDIETGELRGTFSIITRSANELMKQIHNEGVNKHRMPVFMEPKQALQWINEELTDDHISKFLQYEIPADELLAHPVYMIRTTKERPDGKEKYEKYDYGVKMEELLFT